MCMYSCSPGVTSAWALAGTNSQTSSSGCQTRWKGLAMRLLNTYPECVHCRVRQVCRIRHLPGMEWGRLRCRPSSASQTHQLATTETQCKVCAAFQTSTAMPRADVTEPLGALTHKAPKQPLTSLQPRRLARAHCIFLNCVCIFRCRLWSQDDMSHVRTVSVGSCGAWVNSCACVDANRLAVASADRTVCSSTVHVCWLRRLLECA